jgi:hypothetical protein
LAVRFDFIRRRQSVTTIEGSLGYNEALNAETEEASNGETRTHYDRDGARA